MNISNLKIWITIILGTLGIAGYLTGFFKWLSKKIKKLFSFNQEVLFKIPSKSIVIVQENTQFPQAIAWWHMGSNLGNPGMQVVGKFLVTNITKGNILLTGTELKKFKTRGKINVKDTESNFHGDYAIPPGTTTKISIEFWIEPPIQKKGQTFSTDVAIFDQFGNKHWIKKVAFKNI